MTTCLELKQSIQQLLNCGEHEWVDKLGHYTSVTGGTLLAVGNTKADEKAGTQATRLGEEFVSTIPHLGEMGKGKPVSVIRAKRGGMPILLNDTNVTTVALPPDKQKLSFSGVAIADDQRLWDIGVRHDDCISLEFESPTTPGVLKLLRAPDKPKADKKGKKGGGGKKKK